MPTIPPSDQRGTLIALEPRIRAAFHPLYHEICERRDLTPGAKIVYTVLVSYHQRFNDVFPGRDRLARDTGLSKRQLVEHMKTLEDRGLLKMERRSLGLTNRYILLKWPEPRGAVSALPPDVFRTTAGAETAPSQLEEGLEQGAGPPQSEEQAAALWSAALDQLTTKLARGQLLDFEATVGRRLDGETLVVAGPATLNRKWAAYLRGVLGRAVRFES